MIQGFNPRTGERTGKPVAETTDAEVDAAAGAAAAALPEWAGLGAGERARALEAVADALDARVSELVALADEETALGETRLTGEVARTTGQLRLFAGVLRDGGYANPVTSPPGGGIAEIRRINHPAGPVAVFAASNFPFAFSVAGGDTASALAAGCPVVVKAHEGHPGTSELTAQIVTGALAGAGAPAGTFGLVHGFEAGVRLLTHPAVSAAGFTGSTRAGVELARICAEREVPIPFYGELGAVNPVVVLPAAAGRRGTEIASGYAGSLTLGAGQFCTNPGLLFVPADDRGADRGDHQRGQRGQRGPDAVRTDLQGVRGIAGRDRGPPRRDGGGGREDRRRPMGRDPAAVLDQPGRLRRRHPGPVTGAVRQAGLMISYPSVGDLLPILAQLGGNLVGSVHGDAGSAADVSAARQVVAVFERTVGRIVWNGWPTGVAVNAAQHHGGPWPATTVPAYTSVGSAAIRRWLVPVAYQNFPAELLPSGLAGLAD